MSTGAPTPIRPLSYFSSSTRTMLLIWAVVIVGAYLLVHFADQKTTDRETPASPQKPLSERTSVQGPSPEPSLPPGDQPQTIPAATVPVPPPPSPEELAAAESRWIDFLSQVEGIRKRLEVVSKDIDVWSSLSNELPHNEAGRKIAGSPTDVDQFQALVDKPRTPAGTIDAIRDTLQVQSQAAQEYRGQSDNTAIPSTRLMQELDRASSDVEILAKEYRKDRLALETLVSETASVAPAERTLEQVLEQRTAAVAREYRDQLTKAKAAAEAEAQRKIREAEVAAIRTKADVEAYRIERLGKEEALRLRGETDQRVKELQEQADKKKRQEESKRLRALAEDRTVQKKFSAFLEKGYIQFNTSAALNRSQNRSPVSFGDLNSFGWLANAETFARAMSRKPNGEYEVFNDRPTHAYPKTTAEWAEMEQLLEQFKALAPVWVEIELLRP